MKRAALETAYIHPGSKYGASPILNRKKFSAIVQRDQNASLRKEPHGAPSVFMFPKSQNAFRPNLPGLPEPPGAPQLWPSTEAPAAPIPACLLRPGILCARKLRFHPLSAITSRIIAGYPALSS